MKVVRKNEGTHYDAPNHWGCWPMRQHGKDESGATKVWTAMVSFLPEGGGEDNGLPAERIYYVLQGQLTLKSGDQEVTLYEGDSVFCPAGEPGKYWNSGTTPGVNLIIIIPTGS